MIDRREFVASAAAAAFAGAPPAHASAGDPWYRRAYRWGRPTSSKKIPFDMTSRVGGVTGSLPRFKRSSSTLAASSRTIPLQVESPGLIDCHLYTQSGRTILHLVTLTSAATWRAPLDEYIPIGPLKVRVRLTRQAASSAQLRVAKGMRPVSLNAGIASFEIASILDHEVVVL
jgi:hypothetical protein